MPHPHLLLLGPQASPKGVQEDYRRYMNGQYEDHAGGCGPDAAEVTDRIQRLSGSRAAVPEQPYTSYAVAGHDLSTVV